MIELHKLSTSREPFQLNVDLIERIDASPDCHVTLTTGQRIAVGRVGRRGRRQDPRLARRRDGARAAPRALTRAPPCPPPTGGSSVARLKGPCGRSITGQTALPTWSTHARRDALPAARGLLARRGGVRASHHAGPRDHPVHRAAVGGLVGPQRPRRDLPARQDPAGLRPGHPPGRRARRGQRGQDRDRRDGRGHGRRRRRRRRRGHHHRRRAARRGADGRWPRHRRHRQDRRPPGGPARSRGDRRRGDRRARRRGRHRVADDLRAAA